MASVPKPGGSTQSDVPIGNLGSGSSNTNSKRKNPWDQCPQSAGPKKRKKNSSQETLKDVPATQRKKNCASQAVATNLEVATNLVVEFGTLQTKNICEGNAAPPNQIDISWLDVTKSMANRRKYGPGYEQLFAMMMQTSVGKESMIGHMDCLPDVKRYLENFLKRYARSMFDNIVQRTLMSQKPKKKKKKQGHNILQEKRSTKKQLCVTSTQFKEVIHIICTLLIPNELIGGPQNCKLLKKAIIKYYDSGYKDPLDLGPYVHNMNISCMHWLRGVKEERTKKTIVAKVMKWLFESFFIPLVEQLFIVQKSLYSNKKTFMFANTGHRVQRDYIEQGLEEGRFKKINLTDISNSKASQVSSMMLHPKTFDVRPIHRVTYNENEANVASALKVLLNQLYLQRFDPAYLHTFTATWKTETEKNSAEKIHIVSCDIGHAFDSIDQNKLFTIVNDLIAEIPGDILRYESYQVEQKRNRRTLTGTRSWFRGLPVPLSVRKGSYNKPQETENISKNGIQQMLRKIIFEQVFKIGNNYYELTIGVAQGLKLSSILSSLYYQHMTEEEFSIFKQSGKLLRYVDDFIYLTRSRNHAQEFLRAVHNKVHAYNCSFPKKKMKINFKTKCHRRSRWVRYLGFEINARTKQIRVVYRKGQVDYFMDMQFAPEEDASKTFQNRLEKWNFLKLNSVVLSPTINGSDGIRVTAGRAAKMLARRTFILVRRIFRNVDSHATTIRYIIIGLEQRLENWICSQFTPEDSVKWPNFRQDISQIICRTFHRVFARDHIFFKLFGNGLKPMVRNAALPEFVDINSEIFSIMEASS